MLNYRLAGHKTQIRTKHSNHFSQVKLPTIDKKHSEQDKQSLSKIKSAKLPLLNFGESNPIINQHQRKMGTVSQLEQQTNNQFNVNGNMMQEIQEKMKNILKKNQMLNMEYYNSDNENFQKNIAINKQFLKNQRQKRSSVLGKKLKEEYSDLLKQKIKKGRKNRLSTESNQEKVKIKAKKSKYNQSASVHKSKSEFLQLGEEAEQKIAPQGEGKHKVIKLKGAITNRLQQKMNELKQKLGKRKKGDSRMMTEADGEDLKNQNLFDNIHNYLTNPHRLSFDQKNNSPKLKNKSTKRDTQAKIKKLQEKIAIIEPLQIKTDMRYLTSENGGAFDWRRVQFDQNLGRKTKNLSVRQSTFERQINHLGKLQQRNQHSLQRFLQNQRLLADLKLFKTTSNKEQLNREYLCK